MVKEELRKGQRKMSITKKLNFILVLSTLLWGCATSKFFTELEKLEISAGGKIPLKVAVMIPQKDFRASFDKPPDILDKFPGSHKSLKELYTGYKIKDIFLSALKDGLPHLFKQVTFTLDNQSSLPQETQLVILARDLKGRLTDFQANNGRGKSEIEYKLIIKTSSYKTLFEYDGRGSNSFVTTPITESPVLSGSKGGFFYKVPNLSYTSVGISSKYWMNYQPSIRQAIGHSIIVFSRNIKSNHTVTAYAKKVNSILKAEAEIQEQPSDLVSEVRFNDTGSIVPNRILDAGEKTYFVAVA